MEKGGREGGRGGRGGRVGDSPSRGFVTPPRVRFKREERGRRKEGGGKMTRHDEAL